MLMIYEMLLLQCHVSMSFFILCAEMLTCGMLEADNLYFLYIRIICHYIAVSRHVSAPDHNVTVTFLVSCLSFWRLYIVFISLAVCRHFVGWLAEWFEDNARQISTIVRVLFGIFLFFL